MKKLISFDLWNTLVKSNNNFADARIQVIKKFSDCKETDEHIKEIFKDVKYSFDALVEKYGVQFDNNMLYDIVFDHLGIFMTSADDRLMLVKKINGEFLNHLPLIYSDDTIECLEKLKNKGHKLTLISNTLFINGLVINAAIIKLGIRKYFDDVVYSSSAKISKPNSRIFKYAYDVFGFEKSEIIHVGDNIRTDLYGAIQYGVDAYIINNSKTTTQFKNKTITDFVNFLETNN